MDESEAEKAGGTINSDDLYVKYRRQGMDEGKAKSVVAAIELHTKDALAQMSSAAELKIDDYLDARRTLYGITDGAFKSWPLDDRVFIYQLPRVEGETYSPGGSIIMPADIQSAEKTQSTRGVLCAWGLTAQNALTSFDTRLGDVVEFIDMAPWKKLIGRVAGHSEYVLVLRAGLLVGNEDAELRRRSGETSVYQSVVKIKGDPDSGLLKHRILKTDTGGVPYCAETTQPTVMEEY